MATEHIKAEDSPSVGQKLDHAIDAVREKITHGRETIDELRQKDIGALLSATKDFAKNHPGTTLLGGAALGFIAGYLLRGSRKD